MESGLACEDTQGGGRAPDWLVGVREEPMVTCLPSAVAGEPWKSECQSVDDEAVATGPSAPPLHAIPFCFWVLRGKRATRVHALAERETDGSSVRRRGDLGRVTELSQNLRFSSSVTSGNELGHTGAERGRKETRPVRCPYSTLPRAIWISYYFSNFFYY